MNLENIHHTEYLIDKTNHCAITFIAYKIEQRLLNYEHVYCQLCRKVLLENEKMDENDCIGNKIPCRSSFDICRSADIAIRQFIGIANNSLKIKVIQYVMKSINIDHIFSRHFPIEHDITHKYFLIRFIITDKVHLKCQYLSKQKTLDIHNQFLRHKNRKDIHLAGH